MVVRYYWIYQLLFVYFHLSDFKCVHIHQNYFYLQNAPRRMVLVCHYDSKISPQGFLGATDSAVPCAQMINLAHTMKMDLDDHKDSNSELTLQLLFLDGEEAFVQWTSTDSIYGARHLASKLETTNYQYNRIQGSELDRMDIFVLLDLLGAKDPNIISSQENTDVSFQYKVTRMLG